MTVNMQFSAYLICYFNQCSCDEDPFYQDSSRITWTNGIWASRFISKYEVTVAFFWSKQHNLLKAVYSPKYFTKYFKSGKD